MLRVRTGAFKGITLMLLAFLTFFTGCAPANESSTNQKDTNNQKVTTEAASPGAPAKTKDGKEITIGFSQRRLAGDDWYTNLIRGAQTEANKQGVKLVVLDAQGDVAKQVSGVEDLISQGVDAVIMNPQDPSGVIPATNRLKQNHIPLIAVNSNIDPKADPVSFISDDPRDTGYKLGWELAKAASEKYGNKIIKAAMISGFPKELVSQYRRNGIIAGWTDFMLEKYGKANLELVAERFGEWVPDKALTQMQDIGTAHPDLQVLFSLSDVFLPGIFTALKNTGLDGKILIGSMGGMKGAIQKIADEPNSGLVVTVGIDPRVQGAEAVKMAVQVVQGKQVPANENTPNPVINKANAKALYNPNSSY